MLACGMCEVVITPPLGSHMPGYLHDRKSTGVKEQLSVKALVVESEEMKLAIIVADVLYLQRNEVQRIRERVFEHTQIPVEHIMVSATHIHTGPPMRPAFDGSMDENYNALLIEKTADAAILAYKERKPARIGIGTGHEDGISFHRRFWMKDGTVRTNPGFQHPELDRPAGPIDPEVLVVRIDDLEGNPVGVVTNFACHTDTVGGTENCADFPGELSRTLKNILGDHLVSLFVLGACGNINHHDFTKPNTKTPDHYRKMGRILAGEVLKVREKIYMDGGKENKVSLAARNTYFPVPYRYPAREEVESAERVIALETSSETERFFAEQLLQVAVNEIAGTEIEIQTFQVGEMGIVGLPGEIFVEFGMSIKQNSPYRFNMINTLCNGSTSGYVCTREAYEQGGYEPKLRNTSRNSPGNGDLFVKHALEQLEGMKSLEY